MKTYVYSVLVFGLLSGSAQAARITAIDFKQSPGGGELEIQSDAPLVTVPQENKADRQLVFEFDNTTLIKGLERKLDMSSFNSPVVLVSPYQAGSTGKAKVVVQLRENRPYELESKGSTLRIRFGSSVKSPQASADPVPMDDAEQKPEQNVVPKAETATPGIVTTQSDSQSTPASEGNKNLDQFFDNQKEQKWIGRPITLQLRDADLQDVFRFIAEASGFNIVIGEDVRGKITLSLEEVPWDQALDLIMRTRQLGAERNNNILRIVTLAGMTSEKIAELNAKRASQAASPRVTKIFPVSYAKLNELKSTLETLGRTSGGGSANDGLSTMVITTDERTNSLIVQDVPDGMERVKKLVELLDVQTPQVMIEAKIIEAVEGFAARIGGGLGLGVGGANSQWGSGFNGGNPLDPLFPNPDIPGTAWKDSTTFGDDSLGGGLFGFSPTVGSIGLGRLNAFLNLGEQEDYSKTIASPKTVVLSRETANITSTTAVYTQTVEQTAAGSVSGPKKETANVGLTVTPTVNNDGGVLMDLTINRDVPGSAGGVNTRSMKTKVIVESGTTLVIGGLYTDEERHSEGGFPLLRKIPLLGRLFGFENNAKSKSEIFIFITPKVLNAKESGITS